MLRHSNALKEEITTLRAQGCTYAQIQHKIGRPIAKGTLSYICKNVVLDQAASNQIKKQTLAQLEVNRQKALLANRLILSRKIESYRTANQAIIPMMKVREAKLIALAMLYLGEGAKWKKHRGLQLGSSSAEILQLYISLLQSCYGIEPSDLKCRIQHRADHDGAELLAYWSKVTGVTKQNFYPAYIDKRTVGKVTRNKDYKGVCVVSCAGTHIQLELQQIAGIIFEAATGI